MHAALASSGVAPASTPMLEAPAASHASENESLASVPMSPTPPTQITAIGGAERAAHSPMVEARDKCGANLSPYASIPGRFAEKQVCIYHISCRNAANGDLAENSHLHAHRRTFTRWQTTLQTRMASQSSRFGG